MARVGFIKDGDSIVEYLPSSEQFKNKEERRVLFFNLYNYSVAKDMRIAKKDMLQGDNIYEILKDKKKFSSLSNEFLFDIENMFLNLVYERAKLVNKSSKIHILKDMILIEESDKQVSSTLIVTSFSKFLKESICDSSVILENFKKASNEFKDIEIKQLYLIYPKHKNFTKHIEIKFNSELLSTEDKYRVKVIPYSLSFCTRIVNKLLLTEKSNKLKG